MTNLGQTRNRVTLPVEATNGNKAGTTALTLDVDYTLCLLNKV